jgi:muramoyltetrapeptide carboxypeptidase
MKDIKFHPVTKITSGSTIGIFSPSEPVSEYRRGKFDNGVKILQENGFNVKFAKNCFTSTSYTAGSISQRVDDFMSLINDEEVNLLLSSWGGKSCNHLIEKLDYDRIRAAKKPILGFSDACSLLNVITYESNLITFYGPNVAGKLDETKHANLSLLKRSDFSQTGNLLGDISLVEPVILKSGTGRGHLVGGNLNTFVLGSGLSRIGKDYYDGAILFWEETSMPAQIIDQYLTALKNYGVLNRLSGMVIGNFLYDDPQEWKRADVFEVIQDIFEEYDYPILYCPTFGHAKLDNPIIPIGAQCNLDADNSLLSLDGPIVED